MMSTLGRCAIGSFILILLLALVGCMTPRLKSQLADQERMIRQLRSEKASVESRLRSQSAGLADLETRLNDEQSQSRELQEEIDRLSREGASATSAPAAGVASTAPAARDPFAGGKQELERLLEGTQGAVGMRDGNLVISLPGAVTFASGSASLTWQGRQLLGRILGTIRSRYADHTISVEGHTDTDRVRKSKYKNNWRLSVERAMAVREYLQTSGGVDPDRFRVVGYGPHRPVSDNRSRGGKERNRRVEIVIVSS